LIVPDHPSTTAWRLHRALVCGALAAALVGGGSAARARSIVVRANVGTVVNADQHNCFRIHLPLKHAVDLSRALLMNEVPTGALLHVAVLLAYACGAYYVALVLTRRRLLR